MVNRTTIGIGPIDFDLGIGGGGGPGNPPWGGGGLPGGYGPGNPPPGFSLEDQARDLLAQGGRALCTRYLPEGVCDALAGLVGPGNGNGKGGGTQCEDGTVYNPDLDICVFPGSPGAGGGGQPAKGLPPGAVRATTVGNIRGRPIRRCPKRFVLADPALFGEGVCFHKATITNKLRKWPKAPRPPVTAFDAKMMRKYGPGGSKQKSIKKLAGNAGLSCKKK